MIVILRERVKIGKQDSWKTRRYEWARGQPARYFRQEPMGHEPTNEQGVVALFSMIVRDLGMYIETIGKPHLYRRPRATQIPTIRAAKGAHEATMRDSGLHQLWLVISQLSNIYDTWNCGRKVVQMWCRSSVSPITHQWWNAEKRHNPLFYKGLRSGGFAGSNRRPFDRNLNERQVCRCLYSCCNDR